MTPTPCGLSWCETGLPARLYPAGRLCSAHSPAAQAGEIEPEQVARIQAEIYAESRRRRAA